MVSQFNSSLPAYPFPQIDQHQAGRQLEYFGYKRGGKVYLRFFYHSNDPRKDGDKGRKADRLRWEEVGAYQQEGRGVYVVVNGAQGGHEDKEIQQCAAIFCEWDDRPVEDQLLHWETVGFLEPTFTVYSGDKSAQPYWVFDKPITVEQWRELQLLLIFVMGADPANKNPSRVFRLAGGWHIKPGREPQRTEIVQESGIKYSFEQLRERLLYLKAEVISATEPIQPLFKEIKEPATADILELIGKHIPLKPSGSDWKGDCPFCGAVDNFIVKPRHQTFECLNCKSGGDGDNYRNTAGDFLKKYQRNFSGKSQRIRSCDIQVPVPESVPLEVCLSKNSQHLLTSGASEGGRNANGAKLARDLIGTANHLQSIGQRFNGDPWQLFLDYCHRCPTGNGWGESEWKNIWRSAQSDRPTPSCTAVGVETCIGAWYWNNYVKPSQSTRDRTSKVVSHPSFERTGGNGNPPQSTVHSPYELVKTLVCTGITQAELSGALIELSLSTGYSLAGLKNLAGEIEAELTKQSAAPDDAKETSKLLEYREQTLDLKRIFPAPLANFLLTKAESDRIDPAYIYQYLLPAIGLSLGGHIGIEGKEGATSADTWVEFPIYYTMTVAPPSAGKSQTMRSVFGPIKQKQDKARYDFKKDQLHLEQLEKEWNRKSAEEKEKLRDSESNPNVYEEQMPKPPRVKLIEGGTPEGAFKRMSELAPMTGCALAFDELVRVLALDQYKHQGGDTRQTLMEAWSHPYSTEFVRADDKNTISLHKICINITGGIQPAKAKKLLSDPDDGDGLLSRFLIAQTKTPDNFAIWSNAKVDINSALNELYQFLGNLHYDLRKLAFGEDDIQSLVDGKQVILPFDAAAEKRWHQWWEHVRLQMQQVEHENPALFGYLGKMLSQTLRIALGLHCIELMFEQKVDPLIVGLPTLDRAIYAAKFHIGQFRLLQANNDATNLPGQLAKIHAFAQRKGQEVSATQVQNTVFKRSERKPTLAQIREYFKQLADTGLAVLAGVGKDLKILVQKIVGIPTISDQNSDKSKSAQTTVEREVQEPDSKKSDNSDNFSSLLSDFISPHHQSQAEASEQREVLPDPWVEDDPDLPNNKNCRNCRIFEDELPSKTEPEPVVVAEDLSDFCRNFVGNSDTVSDAATIPSGTGFGAIADPNQNQPQPPEAPDPTEAPALDGTERAIAPDQPQTPEAPTEFKVGETCALADPYMKAFTYHGTVEEVAGDNILVRWLERQGKPFERETYHTSELRKLE